ncbi:2-C-methyl-D-erythritol 2,4-cyclodiphosphate synthase [Dubosiella newyorkensis]|uniref:2-C-methyl-D-erythritol 2,4-cyclodiphosphate synthase n=1 Tax=Dubosiella newyorkensis TaxID=1862672 RepID=UPI003F671D69
MEILLLEEVKRKCLDTNIGFGNIDATILAEKPKMAPYIEQMRSTIANALECSTEAISIKATRERNRLCRQKRRHCRDERLPIGGNKMIAVIQRVSSAFMPSG